MVHPSTKLLMTATTTIVAQSQSSDSFPGASGTQLSVADRLSVQDRQLVVDAINMINDNEKKERKLNFWYGYWSSDIEPNAKSSAWEQYSDEIRACQEKLRTENPFTGNWEETWVWDSDCCTAEGNADCAEGYVLVEQTQRNCGYDFDIDVPVFTTICKRPEDIDLDFLEGPDISGLDTMRVRHLLVETMKGEAYPLAHYSAVVDGSNSYPQFWEPLAEMGGVEGTAITSYPLAAAYSYAEPLACMEKGIFDTDCCATLHDATHEDALSQGNFEGKCLTGYTLVRDPNSQGCSEFTEEELNSMPESERPNTYTFLCIPDSVIKEKVTSIIMDAAEHFIKDEVVPVVEEEIDTAVDGMETFSTSTTTTSAAKAAPEQAARAAMKMKVVKTLVEDNISTEDGPNGATMTHVEGPRGNTVTVIKGPKGGKATVARVERPNENEATEARVVEGPNAIRVPTQQRNLRGSSDVYYV